MPRSAQARFDPGKKRFDPVALLERQSADRVRELVPLRYSRMLESPFRFYRGAAGIMAADLGPAPHTGLTTQLCGDAHLLNFRLLASPERHLVFDINDFDETLPGPFEWDLKRLATSLEIAARERGFGAAERSAIVRAIAQHGPKLRIHAVAITNLNNAPSSPCGACRQVLAELGPLGRRITADAEALMGTSSFLDRLRGTGPLRQARAREHGALGPIGKASGYADDARSARPYDAYPELGAEPVGQHSGGDAMTRLRVRFEEAVMAFRFIRVALSGLPERGRLTHHVPCDPLYGRATGWAEAPQGEVLYDLTIEDGRIAHCRPRSASFHNLVLMHEVFAGDILTDFPFIEASFGLSVAGAAL